MEAVNYFKTLANSYQTTRCPISEVTESLQECQFLDGHSQPVRWVECSVCQWRS